MLAIFQCDACVCDEPFFQHCMFLENDLDAKVENSKRKNKRLVAEKNKDPFDFLVALKCKILNVFGIIRKRVKF